MTAADPLPLPDDVFQRAVESFRILPRDQRDIADVRADRGGSDNG